MTATQFMEPGYPAFRKGDLVEVLARVYGISEEHRGKLLYRLQHLQRLKFPASSNLGRGHVAIFDMPEMLQLFGMFELQTMGITSEIGIAMLDQSPEFQGMLTIARGGRPADAFNRWSVDIYFDAMRHMREPGALRPGASKITIDLQPPVSKMISIACDVYALRPGFARSKGAAA